MKLLRDPSDGLRFSPYQVENMQRTPRAGKYINPRYTRENTNWWKVREGSHDWFLFSFIGFPAFSNKNPLNGSLGTQEMLQPNDPQTLIQGHLP